jgi:hypothetical protein
MMKPETASGTLSVDDLELKVRRFVSDKLGVRLDRVHPTSTLGKDFGMGGDEAVEFFDAYAETFQVDITAVRAEWSEFFGPEGSGPSALLFLVPFLVPFVLAAILTYVGQRFGLRLRSELGFAVVAVVGGLLGREEGSGLLRAFPAQTDYRC